MIFLEYAKTRANMNTFKGEKVHDVEIARGKDEDGESAIYFVVSKDAGFFSTEMIARIECHKMHDLEPKHTPNPEENIRAWLLENVDPEYLNDKIRQEKEAHLTVYGHRAKRLVTVKFKDSSFNYVTGIKEGVTEEQLRDFYICNVFKRLDIKGVTKQECISISIHDNNKNN